MSGGLFIGTIEDYEERQARQSNGSFSTFEDKEVKKIAYDNMDPISDEDLKLLKQTRNRHDALTVYMQPDEHFYDEFYHRDSSEDVELLAEAKKIKRLYKSYPKYLYAMYIRDTYIDSLVQKYGGQDRFDMMWSLGAINEWIPPTPLFSKTSPDYQQYLDGRLIIMSRPDNDYDEFEKQVELLTEEKDLDTDSIGVVGDVITEPIMLKNLDCHEDSVNYSRRYSNNTINGVSTNDLIALQQMFRQWYRDDTVANTTTKSELFMNTPESIRARYYTKPLVDMKGQKFGGPIIEQELDPNEMVMDLKLNRPMTRAELGQREFIRMLSNAGWNELRMMKYLGVGSKYEQQLMFQKQKRHKMAKKKATGLIDAIVGNDSDIGYIDSIDQLRGALFDDGD